MTSQRQAHQIELERLYNKNQLIPRIKEEFKTCTTNFKEYMEKNNLPVEFGFDLLVQMVLHKRASLETLIGCLRHHFKDSQMTADMLELAINIDLVDYDPELKVFIIIYNISEDVQQELDRFQFPLPMVVEPLKIKNNKMTGMLDSAGSIILRNNHHNDDVCLDHINRLNKNKFTINQTIVTKIKNEWRNLDKPKEGESHEDFKKRKRAFEKYDHTAKDVINLINQEGNEFYLTHKYDKRGRSYCLGYHITYQGAPWNKACIEFADKEYLNE